MKLHGDRQMLPHLANVFAPSFEASSLYVHTHVPQTNIQIAESSPNKRGKTKLVRHVISWRPRLPVVLTRQEKKRGAKITVITKGVIPKKCGFIKSLKWNTAVLQGRLHVYVVWQAWAVFVLTRNDAGPDFSFRFYSNAGRGTSSTRRSFLLV